MKGRFGSIKIGTAKDSTKAIAEVITKDNFLVGVLALVFAALMTFPALFPPAFASEPQASYQAIQELSYGGDRSIDCSLRVCCGEAEEARWSSKWKTCRCFPLEA